MRVGTKLSQDWVMMSNPPGLGKSWLAAGFASEWSGPALFTDLISVEPTKAAVEAALAKTVQSYVSPVTKTVCFLASMLGGHFCTHVTSDRD